ncbi:hypothetical protein K502DRAFT_255860 [Neoconidiobolus thromboides FSU 785]|nr:hypothetical protein K502DRAFT_255860 [Neoconidiobolus thromboides FSU 785]
MLSFQFTSTYIDFYSNSLSITLILFSLSLLTLNYFITKEFHQSASYRLSILILLADLFYGIGTFLGIHPQITVSKPLCYVYQWLSTFSISISVSYSTVIAVIYLLNIVYEYRLSKIAKYIVYLLPLLISLLTSLLPIIFNKINTQGTCGYNSNYDGLLWFIVSNFMAIFIACCLCPIIYGMIIHYLLKKHYQLRYNNSYLLKSQYQFQFITYLRLIFYSLVPIVSHSINIFMSIMRLANIPLSITTIHRLSYFGNFLIGTQGFINSILFLTNSIFLKELDQVYHFIFEYKRFHCQYEYAINK